MKKLVTMLMVVAVAASASALTFNYASLADASYYVNYDAAVGNVTQELVAGEDGYALSCYNTSQGEYPANIAAPVIDASGKFGGALNGSMGWMDLHMVDDAPANIQDLSLSFWVRRAAPTAYWDNIVDNRDGGMAYLWEVRDGWSLDESLVDFTTTTSIDYQMLQMDFRDGEEKVKVGFNGGGGWHENVVNTESAIEDQGWHHVALVYHGHYAYQPEGYQGTMTEMFIDGVSYGLQSTNNGWGSLRLEAFGFGTHYAKSGMGIADDFDDLGVWERALTADEIAWLASGVAPIAVPEPATMALLGLGALVLRRKK